MKPEAAGPGSARGLRRWAGGLLSLALLALTLGALPGCGPARPEAAPGQGLLSLAVTAPPQTARLIAVISRGLGPDFPPVIGELSFDGEAWKLYATQVPAGPGRRFEVVAYDPAGLPAFNGSTEADVLPGGATTVFMMLQPQAPPAGSTDALPVFDLLWTSQVTAAPGGTVEVGVVAHDPDPGDWVTYLWTASCGSFDSPASPTPTWTAPALAGVSCDLTITCSDNHGASVSATLTVAVR
jgi:hypothetical protein